MWYERNCTNTCILVLRIMLILQCINVYIYTVRVYIFIYVCILVCLYTCTYIIVHPLYICKCMNMYSIYIHTALYRCACIRVYLCVCTRMVSTLDVPTRGHIHEEYLRTQ
jgi:hypothetical protein